MPPLGRRRSQVGFAGPDPGSIPERTDEGDRGLEPAPGQEAGQPLELAQVFGVLIAPPVLGNTVGGEKRIPVIVAREQFTKDAGAKVGLFNGGPGAENPAAGASPDEIRLEAGVDAVLAGQLPVKIHDGVQGLGQVGGVVRVENGGAVGFVPAPAAQRLGEAQRETLDLPGGVSVSKLCGARLATLLDKEPLEGQKSVGFVGVRLGVVVRALVGILTPQQISVDGMLDQIGLAGAKVGTKRLGQVLNGGSVDEAVAQLAPSARRRGEAEGQRRDQHGSCQSRHPVICTGAIQGALISDCIP